MPAPPASESSAKTSRTSVASTFKVDATPPQTPAMIAVVVAPFEGEDGDLGHPARTTSTRPAPTRASR